MDKVFSQDLDLVKKKAGSSAYSFFHTWVGTPHLFMTSLSFLNDNKDTPRYKPTYDKLKALLTVYDITGKKFKDEFLKLMPAGMEPLEGEDFVIKYHQESTDVFNVLSRNALSEKRSMEVEDLIRQLFAEKSYRVYSVFESLLGTAPKADEFAAKIIELFKEEAKREIKELEKVKELTNLNRFVKDKAPVFIGGENAIKQIELGLAGKSIANVCLVGRAGTGKTSAVYEFVRRINDGEVIDELKNKIVYQLDSSALVAGTRYRGDFEEKLMNIIRLVKANPNVIVFVDEAHQMVKLGDSEGAASAGNIIKPYITRGELQLIFATTDDEYSKNIEPDKALARRFHNVNVSEPTKSETRQILMGVLPSLEVHFKKKGSEELVDKVIKIAEKYTIDQANPAKALNMLELAFANSKVFNNKNEIVFSQDILDAIKIKYDIKISDQKTESVSVKLNSMLLGQEEPLKKVINNLRYVEKGLVDTEKPLVSMIFAGPTGVGKTETAKIIAEQFCGSEKYLIKINMGEYGNEMDVTKITGASPGYVGHENQSGLVALVKQYPNSVVLFDEIEKAHPKVFDTILNILDTGEMTDNHKNRVSFRNTIIIFTTNLGYDKDFAKSRGVGFVKNKTTSEDIKESVESHFRPEFINRIDDIVIFNGLNKDIAQNLIMRYAKEYEDSMELKGELVFTINDIAEIITVADIETFGARGLKRAVRKQVLKVLDRANKVVVQDEPENTTPTAEEAKKSTKTKKVNKLN
jgi:ATP-dependent Clp protease ATP-binding subunit ClpA